MSVETKPQESLNQESNPTNLADSSFAQMLGATVLYRELPNPTVDVAATNDVDFAGSDFAGCPLDSVNI